ncbi:hypothetical protein AAEU28_17050 [Pseudoalteromonas sp. SS15]|uniref:hypothetical protein n=1 Tax=Pseudoalteromonas sp. SS15 TaxID=3139393 RepID=UPI003BA9BF06
MGQQKRYLEQEEHKRVIAEMIAVEAEAIKPCGNHEDVLLSMHDMDANTRAYKIAAKHFKRGEYDEFESQGELTDLIKEVIDTSHEECYSCSKW